MASAFDTMLAEGLDALIGSELGQSVSYVPLGGLAVTVTAVVTWPSFNEGALPGTSPKLLLNGADLLADPARGDSFVVLGNSYVVHRAIEKPPGIWQVVANG